VQTEPVPGQHYVGQMTELDPDLVDLALGEETRLIVGVTKALRAMPSARFCTKTQDAAHGPKAPSGCPSGRSAHRRTTAYSSAKRQGSGPSFDAR
jgi:hypothetical protein